MWRYEFQNVLAKALRARLIAPESALAAWRKASTQMAKNEHEPNPEKVIDLANRHGLTAYDANFIALALEMDVLCVTEDGELQEKFPSIAVSMKDFVKPGGSHGKVQESRTADGVRKR